MIYPSADKLESWGSKYSLVVLAAKRAKQLKSGAAPLVDTDSRNPLTVALEEIAAGAIECRVPDNDILPTATEAPEVTALLAITEEPAEEVEVSAEAAAETELKGAAVALLGEGEDTEELEGEEEVVEEDEETEEGLPGFGDEEDTSGLTPDVDEVAPEDEAIAVPKKPGRKRKAKAEPVPEALQIDKEEGIEVPDEDSDD